MKKSIYIFGIVVLFLYSCQSTKKFNESVTKTHSIKELREDVDFLFSTLNKNFPRLYDYISEEELNQKVAAFKAELSPMTSSQFYHKLAPLVAEVKQGHLMPRRPFEIRDRKERKRYRRAHDEYDDIDFKWVKNAIYVEDTYKDLDSLIIGSKVVAIDSFSTENIVKNWYNKITSDGFNNTFQKPIIADNLLAFYRYDVGRTDSITLHLQRGDSIFTQPLKIVFENKKQEDTLTTKNKDSKLNDDVKKLTRAEKMKQRLANKKQYRDKRKRGYSAYKNQNTREFKLIGNDSNIAYLKIRGFSGGDRWSRKFYEETFMKLDSLDVENLILDLRDNTGGSLKEIGNLYSYLAKEEFTLINPMETKRRLIVTSFLWSGKSTFFGNFFKGLATPFTFTVDLIKSKSEGKTKYYRHKFTKPSSPSPHAFKGDLFVLINGASYSASSILSSNLHGSERATFIGEETGGAYNGTVAGLKMNKYLPNTQIIVPVWMMHLETPYKDEPNGFGIKPDIELEPNLEDFLSGKDTVLERAIEEIEKSKS